MLKPFKIFKNKRDRFISFELQDNKYVAYLLDKNGNYNFITLIDINNEKDYIKKLNLTIVNEIEHTKTIFYKNSN